MEGAWKVLDIMEDVTWGTQSTESLKKAQKRLKFF